MFEAFLSDLSVAPSIFCATCLKIDWAVSILSGWISSMNSEKLKMASYLTGMNFCVIALTISCDTTPPMNATSGDNWD